MTLYFVPFAASLLNLTGTKPVVASAAAAMLVLAPSSAVPSAESVVKFFSSFRRFSRYLFLSPSFSSLVLTIGRKRGELRKSFTSASSSSSSSSSSSLEPSSVPIVCFLFKPPPLPPTRFFPVFRVVSVVIFFPMALSESHLNSSSAQAASFSFSFSGSILSRSSSSSSFVLLVLSSLLKMLLTFVFVVVAIFCLLLLLLQ